MTRIYVLHYTAMFSYFDLLLLKGRTNNTGSLRLLSSRSSRVHATQKPLLAFPKSNVTPFVVPVQSLRGGVLF